MLKGLKVTPANTDATMVVFRPGTTAADAFAAVAAADGRVMWAHESGELLAVHFDPASNGWASTWRLYRHGALLVGVCEGVSAPCYALSLERQVAHPLLRRLLEPGA